MIVAEGNMAPTFVHCMSLSAPRGGVFSLGRPGGKPAPTLVHSAQDSAPACRAHATDTGHDSEHLGQPP